MALRRTEVVTHAQGGGKVETPEPEQAPSPMMKAWLSLSREGVQKSAT